MNNLSEYPAKTRIAYQNTDRAIRYKAQQTTGISWMRFTSWKEKSCVARSLACCGLTETDRILDIPCGTGLLGSVFCKFPSLIIASDISGEMVTLSHNEYSKTNFGGFVLADITKTPFKKTMFDCVITVGLMHRLPDTIRKEALKEIVSLSRRFIIVSYSIDSVFQRIKQRLIKKLCPAHQSALSPVPLRDIIKELKSNGLILKKKFKVMPLLSTEVVFLMEKPPSATFIKEA